MYIILTSWLLLKEVMTVVSYSMVEKNIYGMSDTQTVTNKNQTLARISVVDPDPHGSALILEGWIRILSGKANSVPDLVWQKNSQKRKK